MRKLLVALSLSVATSFSIVACVGDDVTPAPTTTTATQGALGGACYANGTCNAGLTCAMVDGAAKCTTSGGGPTGDASTTEDAAVGSPDTGTSTAPGCKFQTTAYPCGDPMPPTVCYGATQSCTLTGCNQGDIRWACNSARQCGTACCVRSDSATLAPGANCTEGTLLMTAGTTAGATCATTTACAAGDTQLCQASSDCPTGQRCTPVKVIGAGAALNGTIVAACVK